MTASASVSEATMSEGNGSVASALSPPRLAVDVIVEDAAWTEVAAVESLIAGAAAAVSCHPSARVATGMEVAIALDTDAAVRRLNCAFRGRDKPTNVLSFPTGTRTGGHLGDIILARETVVAEAKDLGISVAQHLQHLVVHGLLHLLGFDHQSDSEATVMEALETEILAMIGLPDPYADSDVITSN